VSLADLFVPATPAATTAPAAIPPPLTTLPPPPDPIPAPITAEDPDSSEDEKEDEEDAEDDLVLGVGLPPPLATDAAAVPLPAPLEPENIPQILESAVTEVVESVLGGDMPAYVEYLGEMKKLPRMERQKSKKALLARINQTRQTAIITPNLSSSSISTVDQYDSESEEEEYDDESSSGEEDDGTAANIYF